RPSSTRPVPTRLHGLSPDHATTRAGGRRYRCCQYRDSRPTMVEDGASDGSLPASDGAVASIAGGHHWHVPSSIRFMPEPSPGSSVAWAPASSDAMNELTR